MARGLLYWPDMMKLLLFFVLAGSLLADGPVIIAHRGNSAHAPENTMASFESAVAAKADWVELDVHLTADGDAIVIHDETVDRTTDGKGRVADLTTSQLKALDAGKWFDPRFAGERLPLLGEVLARMNGRAPVLIELKHVAKDGEVEAARAERLVARCLELVRAQGMEKRVRFHTFYPANLKALKKLARGIPYDFLYNDPKRRHLAVLFAKSHGASGYNPSLKNTSRQVVSFARHLKLSVWSYTANTDAEFAKALALPADGIITDRPAELRAYLARAAR
jgi:glycerophosphoryl diester phosphodiesterase